MHFRIFFSSSGESNFHAFYYIYDGLEHDKRLKEFHLDRELRQVHSYLPSDRQDSKTKQVGIERKTNLSYSFPLYSAHVIVLFSDQRGQIRSTEKRLRTGRLQGRRGEFHILHSSSHITFGRHRIRRDHHRQQHGQ